MPSSTPPSGTSWAVEEDVVPKKSVPTRSNGTANAASATTERPERTFATNRQARHEYEILESIEAGIALTYATPDARVTPNRVLSGSPVTVGIINAVVAGVLAAFIVDALGGATGLYVGAGVVCGLAYLGVFAAIPIRQFARIRRELQPRFPGEASDSHHPMNVAPDIAATD